MSEPAQICAPARDLRDRLGGALRRHRNGLMRPLWENMTDGDKEVWRRLADKLMRIAPNVGVKLDIEP